MSNPTIQTIENILSKGALAVVNLSLLDGLERSQPLFITIGNPQHWDCPEFIIQGCESAIDATKAARVAAESWVRANQTKGQFSGVSKENVYFNFTPESTSTTFAEHVDDAEVQALYHTYVRPKRLKPTEPVVRLTVSIIATAQDQ
jgi:hypothetical protein